MTFKNLVLEFQNGRLINIAEAHPLGLKNQGTHVKPAAEYDNLFHAGLNLASCDFIQYAEAVTENFNRFRKNFGYLVNLFPYLVRNKPVGVGVLEHAVFTVFFHFPVAGYGKRGCSNFIYVRHGKFI